MEPGFHPEFEKVYIPFKVIYIYGSCYKGVSKALQLEKSHSEILGWRVLERSKLLLICSEAGCNLCKPLALSSLVILKIWFVWDTFRWSHVGWGLEPDGLSMFSPQVSQTNANLGNLMNLKTEGDGNQAGAGEPTPYLGKAVKALVQEKLSEPWKMYLRR